jgi:hypothetical protein
MKTKSNNFPTDPEVAFKSVKLKEILHHENMEKIKAQLDCGVP